ncbi:MAG: glycosyltransferase [Hyphomicrobiales bacterium]|nr:glycosyltransferase [Hyphomicrobiales bacterium]
MTAISIIIPAFNCERWIGQSVSSALTQSLPPHEVIVVDDGSSDQSAARAREAGAHVIARAHAGVSAARNAGVGAATGDWLMFLDADDLLAPHALQAIARAADGVDAVLARHVDFDDRTGIESPCVYRLAYRDAYANACRNIWFQGAVAVRRTPLQWNENRTLWEGLEYLLEYLAPPETRAAFIEDVVTKVRQHRSADRLSSRFDHFEPAMTGAFFVERKNRLGPDIGFERASALDYRIASNANSLWRAGRASEAAPLLDAISWAQVQRYDWYRAGSFAWAVKRLGRRLGPRLLLAANRALGRA